MLLGTSIRLLSSMSASTCTVHLETPPYPLSAIASMEQSMTTLTPRLLCFDIAELTNLSFSAKQACSFCEVIIDFGGHR